MTLMLNFIMTVFATMSFLCSISYFVREKSVGRIRYYILYLGLACAFANLGYMLMSVIKVSPLSIVYRDIGLFGVDMYLFFEVFLVLDQLQVKKHKALKNLSLAVMSTYTVLCLMFHGAPNDVHFESVNGFTTYVSNNTIGYYLQPGMTVITMIILIPSVVIWYKQQTTKRGKSFVVLCIVSNVIYLFSAVPYYFDIELAHPAFSYCIGTMLAYVVIWYASIRLSGFNVTTQALSSDIFHSINIGLLVFNEKGKLALRNEFAKRELNLEVVNNQKISEIFNITDDEQSIILADIIEKQEVSYEYTDKNTQKNYVANCTLKKDQFGEVLCILAVIYDVTKEKKMIEEVISANEAKSDFLASMSHEIRTPINAVLGMNELILRESKEPEIVNYASDVARSGRVLLSLINDILDFSKIESGKMDIIPVDYDLANLVLDIENMFDSRAREKGLDFVVEVDENLPCKIRGDEIRVRQILMNLLSNAIKYTEKGYVKLVVGGEKLATGLELRFDVVDTGKGIKKEDQAVLFDSFTRVDEIQNRTIEGTGLGLSLANSFVKMMSGRIDITSVYGKGSTFIAYIMQEVVVDEPIGDIQKHISQRENDRAIEGTKLYAPKSKVLVVDDVKMNCKVFCGLLKESGMQIDTALSGAEALEKCKEKKYDMIFMDHRMPIMDGIECFHRIQKMDSMNQSTPVIILTANAISGMREKYIEEGFVDFLSKPINYSYLEKVIINHIPHLLQEKPQEDVIAGAQNEEHEDVIAEAQNEEQEAVEKFSRLEIIKNVFQEIDVKIGLEYCMDDEEFYASMIKEFAALDKQEALDACLEEENYKDFRTYVHAIKSTALTIGATTLSDKAKELEVKASNMESEDIKKLYPIFIKEYSEFIGKIKKLEDKL